MLTFDLRQGVWETNGCSVSLSGATDPNDLSPDKHPGRPSFSGQIETFPTVNTPDAHFFSCRASESNMVSVAPHWGAIVAILARWRLRIAF